ncbi:MULTISPECIES: ABC transporter ATP-binding protein [Mameliella]|uniref:ABC transporter ATP-binding protein n=1 Tax=Mameliella TaxID=1434019 RepID=UPI000B52D6BE|nr:MULTISPECIES: ABC transporter ATP-binding protein [Mameliella]MBY6119786.1 ABC transporter ATP-binding protein [Mameliella alba]MDD9728810.1 ABC transporter ATP-binding protein [Mameliella sp. AT18]OWV45484.1 nitrate/sulfonate/bicarbonate ABC transporter ATP-binding protein [Mameliella alba]OWV65784.1 nitrate/sulfonate/bicarbonate ABC transporter ATP-binding protein [Mameliella alba]
MAQVEKTFHGGVVALRNMNLTVNEGDFVSLLGPSGCGKSTALKLVTGLMQPTSGRIDWAGEDGAGEKGAGDLGVVFQEPTLMPWARVMDNVYLPFRIRGVPFAEVRDEVLEVLRLVGLEKFQRAFPRELSGGMKMRVSIARALVTKPRLILMDEPFAALDEITRFKLNNDLLALREKIGCTVIFVTHSVFESVFLSDRVVVMAARPGRVIEELTVDAPYPRSEAFRTSAEYARYCRLASNALHRATGEAA